jgi:hypothetical protein
MTGSAQDSVGRRAYSGVLTGLVSAGRKNAAAHDSSTGLLRSTYRRITVIVTLINCTDCCRSSLILRESAVGIATGYWLDDWGVGVLVPVGARIFTSPCCPDRLCGPHNLLSNVPGDPSPEVKRPGREADHSPPTSAEVKKTWIYTSTPPYNFVSTGTRTPLPYLFNIVNHFIAVSTLKLRSKVAQWSLSNLICKRV